MSQGVGVATGIQDKFSWNAVGLAALSAGVGASGVGDKFANAVGVTKGAAHVAVSGMVNSALTQGIAVATGLQDKFDWAGVAGAALGPIVARGVNGLLPTTAGAAARFVAQTGASLIANAAVRTLIDGTDFGDNILAALPDVLGQTIGGAFAKSVSYAANTQKTTAEAYGSVFTSRYAAALKTQTPLNAVTDAYQTADILSDIGDFFSDAWDATLGRFFDDDRTQSPAGAGNSPLTDEIVVTAE